MSRDAMDAPPPWMQAGDAACADGARKHAQELLRKKSSRFSISRRPHSPTPPPPPPTDAEPALVEFRDTRHAADDGDDIDQFRWAILYENQRGITIFSTAYYSARSLLPHDPPPFTVPDAGPSAPSSTHPHHAQPPNVSLTTYPLPDPTWRWVSAAWLVDMRGDGDVQHDGFEYNWFFRRTGWRARVGWLSAGGYVRRRRWVRLMMRPSAARRAAEAVEPTDTHAPEPDPGAERVWRGDAGDWARVRGALKVLARDGPRLDLWEDWLADLVGTDILAARQQTRRDVSEDSTPEPEPEDPGPDDPAPVKSEERPSRAWILAVLRDHGRDLRSCFIYPDSRAQLRDLLVAAGLAQDTPGPTPGPYLPVPPSASAPLRDVSNQFLGLSDFWSRSSELNLVVSTDDVTMEQKHEHHDVSPQTHDTDPSKTP